MRGAVIDLELISPTLLVSRAGRSGYSTLTSHIPGSYLRGAILSTLFREETIKEERLVEESLKPGFVVHPAYPVVNGKVSKPATVYAFSCKLTKKVFHCINLADPKTIEEIVLRAMKPSDLLGNCLDQIRYMCPEEIRGIAGAFKRILGKPIAQSNHKTKIAEIETSFSTSVSINKRLKAAEIGMLYSYEYIEPGHLYRTIIADLNGDIIEGLEGLEEVGVGRGISRGFGRAKIRIRKEFELKEELERISEELGRHLIGDRMLFYAQGPVSSFRPDLSSPSLPIIEELDSNWIGIKGFSINIIRFNHTALALGGLMRFESFSYLAGLPRINLTASKPGSIFLYEIKGDNALKALAKASITGWNKLACLGLNILWPLGWWINDPIYGD